MLRTPLPEIPAFRVAKPLQGDAVTTVATPPSMVRPELSSLVVESPSKIPAAGGKGSVLAARRSASMGSQAMQESMSQKLQLLGSRLVQQAKPQKVSSALASWYRAVPLHYLVNTIDEMYRPQYMSRVPSTTTTVPTSYIMLASTRSCENPHRACSYM